MRPEAPLVRSAMVAVAPPQVLPSTRRVAQAWARASSGATLQNSHALLITTLRPSGDLPDLEEQVRGLLVHLGERIRHLARKAFKVDVGVWKNVDLNRCGTSELL